MAFLNSYVICPTSVTGVIKLDEPLRYVDRQGRCWEIPAGFASDISRTSCLWHIVGHPSIDYLPAIFLKDYLYYEQRVDREDADYIFLQALQDLGICSWRRDILWLGARIAGRWCWDRAVWMTIVILILLAFALEVYNESHVGNYL